MLREITLGLEMTHLAKYPPIRCKHPPAAHVSRDCGLPKARGLEQDAARQIYIVDAIPPRRRAANQRPGVNAR